MKLRVARHTDRLAEIVGFYRDRVGLVEIGRLVLYDDTTEARKAVAARIGLEPVFTANPYWNENALAYADPDGFLLLLALGV